MTTIECVRKYVIYGLSLYLSFIVNVQADEIEAGSKIADITGKFDLSIPQSPAFTFLGVNGDKVVKADDYRSFTASILQGLNSDGKPASGVAIDARPYLIAFGAQSTLGQYRKSYLIRTLSSAQVSYATASSDESATNADKYAIGLNIKLWRQHDPMMGKSVLKYKDTNNEQQTGTLNECYADYLTRASKPPNPLPEDLVALEESIANKARESVKFCLTPFKATYWNSGSAEVGFLRTKTTTGNDSESGSGYWVGLSYALGAKGQAVFSTSYENDKQLEAAASGEIPKGDELNIGVRLRYGSDKGTFMIEALQTEIDLPNVDDESFARANLGVEFLVMKDVWIQLAIGKAFSTDMFEDDVNFSGQLRFGFSENSLLASAAK